jgi:hypothetical protein
MDEGIDEDANCSSCEWWQPNRPAEQRRHGEIVNPERPDWRVCTREWSEGALMESFDLDREGRGDPNVLTSPAFWCGSYLDCDTVSHE